MNKLRLLGAISGFVAILLIAVNAQATPVTYTVEGDLHLAGDSDLYSLDGAHFVWSISADTSSTRLSGSFISPDGLAASYQSLGSSFYFTSRSNGANDATTSGTAPRLWTANYPVTSTAYDLFEIRDSWLTGEFDGLQVLTYFVNFSPDFYLEDGFATLPSAFDFNDAVAAGWGRFTSSSDITETSRYEVTNWSISVSTIPIPPALWLFGSGLLGLIGMARRKT